MLFRHCFGFDRVKISVNSDKSADGEAVELLYKCICKRKKFIPIQYILGESIDDGAIKLFSGIIGDISNAANSIAYFLTINK